MTFVLGSVHLSMALSLRGFVPRLCEYVSRERGEIVPIKAVGAPSLEVLKARLDGALGSLVWYEMCRLVALRVAARLELDDG